MLKELKITNFRGFDEEVVVRFAPITVFIGKNNSGKSSIINFLLMLQQSLSQDSADFLVARGDRVDLGEFYDLKNVITKKRNLNFSLGIKENSSPRGTLSGYLHDRDIGLDAEIIHRVEADIAYNKKIPFQGKDHSISLSANGEEILSISGNISSDSRFLDFSDADEGELVNGIAESLQKTHAENSCMESIAYYLASMRHLSPTRESIKRTIDIGLSIPKKQVGKNGKYAMNHIWEIQNDDEEKYKFILEHIKSVAGIERIDFNRVGSLAECIAKNKKTGAKTNISNFGFGVSQSIPIFIQGARMAPYTTLMVEQPEAQVHPTAQLELGSFFADLWKKFQVGSVIETHSDNILLRLRHLIAKKELETGDVSIVFFDNKNNKAVIKNLEIKQDGSLEEGLPMEFFHKNIWEAMELGANT